eukprot:CAMPEP_0179199042 /NCGR_PEP_ID=MMETSP0796-20121207/99016_1 /TAXON_ID=73915 /ORGANISM="Pyrodinium bahamense, Strain pbaha01" /LENGTH=66 /DNA_ID=CAMNT_0020903521 /DNA_START=10 /DNA_END=206 /DNA_ORIENTATION=-
MGTEADVAGPPAQLAAPWCQGLAAMCGAAVSLSRGATITSMEVRSRCGRVRVAAFATEGGLHPRTQ